MVLPLYRMANAQPVMTSPFTSASRLSLWLEKTTAMLTEVPTPEQAHVPLFCTLSRNTFPTPVPGRRSGLSSHFSAVPLVPLKLLQLHQWVPRPENPPLSCNLTVALTPELSTNQQKQRRERMCS